MAGDDAQFKELLKRLGITVPMQINSLCRELSQSEKENYVDDKFDFLLTTIEFDDQAKIALLQQALSQSDKERLLRLCLSTVRQIEKFSVYDERLISYFNSEPNVDSILLLNLKHKIKTSPIEWHNAFCAAGGFQVLIENIDNCLRAERTDITPLALYELMSCVHHVVGIVRNPRELVVTETRGAIDAFFMTLQLEDSDLTLKVLEVLNVILNGSGTEDPVMEQALREIMAAARHLASSQQALPLSFLVNALDTGDLNVKVSVMVFLKTWMMQCVNDIDYRMQIRLLLQQSGFSAAVKRSTDALTQTAGRNEIAKGLRPASIPRRQPYTIDGMCYVACDGGSRELPASLIPLRQGELTWVRVHNRAVEFWRGEDELTPTSSRPMEGPLAVFNISSVKCLNQFTSNADMQTSTELVFRLELNDGPIINFGFLNDQYELFEAWKAEFWYLIKESIAELAVWSRKQPPEKWKRQTWLNCVRFYEGFLVKDLNLIREVLEGGNAKLLSASCLQTIIEWRISSTGSEFERGQNEKSYVSLLRQLAKTVLRDKPKVADHGKFDPSDFVVPSAYESLVDSRDDTIARLDGEIKTLRDEIQRLSTLEQEQKSDEDSAVEKRKILQLVGKLFTTKKISPLKANFLRVVNAIRKHIENGTVDTIPKYVKPIDIDRSSKFSEFGKFAKFHGMKEHIRLQMLIESFSKTEISNFFAGSNSADEAAQTMSSDADLAEIVRLRERITQLELELAQASSSAAVSITAVLTPSVTATVAEQTPVVTVAPIVLDSKFEKYSAMRRKGTAETKIRLEMKFAKISEEDIEGFFSRPVQAAEPSILPIEAAVDTTSDVPDRFAKYGKMLKNGLPEGAVRQKMMTDGVSSADIDSYFGNQSAVSIVPCIPSSDVPKPKLVLPVRTGPQPTKVAVDELNVYRQMLPDSSPEQIRAKMFADGRSELDVAVVLKPPMRQYPPAPAGTARKSMYVQRTDMRAVCESLWRDVTEIDLEHIHRSERRTLASDIHSLFSEPVAAAKVVAVEEEIDLSNQPVKFENTKRIESMPLLFASLKITDIQAIGDLVTNLNPGSNYLNLSRTTTLISMLPFDSEVELVLAVKPEEVKSKLNFVGKVFRELASCPRVNQRLQVHETVFTFDRELQDITQKIKLLSAGCDDIINSLPRMKVFFTYALSFVNFLNVGQKAYERAHALPISYLAKLHSIKRPRSDYSLLNYIDDVLSENGQTPFYRDWECDMATVMDCKTISFTALQKHFAELVQKAQFCKNELEVCSNWPAVVREVYFRPLTQRLQTFLSSCDKKLADARAAFSIFLVKLGDIRRDLCMTNCPDDECPSQQIFSTIADFAKLYRTVHNKNIAARPPARPIPPREVKHNTKRSTTKSSTARASAIRVSNHPEALLSETTDVGNNHEAIELLVNKPADDELGKVEALLRLAKKLTKIRDDVAIPDDDSDWGEMEED